MKTIRVAIAEEDGRLRRRLARILTAPTGLALSGQASNGKEAGRVVERLKPDILLLSMTLPDLGGIEAIPSIRKKGLATKLVVLMRYADDASAAAVIRGGARGYMMKSAPASAVVRAIKAVHAGEVWAEEHIVTKLLDELSSLFESEQRRTMPITRKLTEKEMWVARLVALGLRNTDIARTLAIGEKTVKAHLTRIFRKLGLKSRVQLALFIGAESGRKSSASAGRPGRR